MFYSRSKCMGLKQGGIYNYGTRLEKKQTWILVFRHDSLQFAKIRVYHVPSIQIESVFWLTLVWYFVLRFAHNGDVGVLRNIFLLL